MCLENQDRPPEVVIFCNSGPQGSQQAPGWSPRLAMGWVWYFFVRRVVIVMADSWLVERDVAIIHHFFHKCSTCFHIFPKYLYMCLPFFHGSYIVHLFSYINSSPFMVLCVLFWCVSIVWYVDMWQESILKYLRITVTYYNVRTTYV